MEVHKVKLRGSSIWHNRTLGVTCERSRKLWRSLNVKSNEGVTARRAVETAQQKLEHRPGWTKEKARLATRIQLLR